MPTFYEGAPVSDFSFFIDKELYIKARYKEENSRTILSSHEFKVSLCATLSLLFLVSAPYFLRRQGSLLFPIFFVLLSLAALYFFLAIEPKQNNKVYQEAYSTNKFLQEKQTVCFYRDSMIYENRFEKYTQYYTDFISCIESDSFIVFTGGKREYLIVNTSSLESEEKGKISATLISAFAKKYKRIKT